MALRRAPHFSSPAAINSPIETNRSPRFRPSSRISGSTRIAPDASSMPSCKITIAPGARFLVITSACTRAEDAPDRADTRSPAPACSPSPRATQLARSCHAAGRAEKLWLGGATLRQSEAYAPRRASAAQTRVRMREHQPVPVIEVVIADLVAARANRRHYVGVPLGAIANQEKCGAHGRAAKCRAHAECSEDAARRRMTAQRAALASSPDTAPAA